MTLTKLVTMLTKEAMIFSKMVDEIHTKFLAINVKYSVAMKRSFYSLDLLLIFQKYLVNCNDSNYVFNSVNEKNNDFLQKWSIKFTQNSLKCM